MKNNFLNYKQSLKLQNLGFSEDCFGYFENKDRFIYGGVYSSNNNIILAPTHKQAIDFLLEIENNKKFEIKMYKFFEGVIKYNNFVVCYFRDINSFVDSLIYVKKQNNINYDLFIPFDINKLDKNDRVFKELVDGFGDNKKCSGFYKEMDKKFIKNIANKKESFLKHHNFVILKDGK